jgi:hypothetical protein
MSITKSTIQLASTHTSVEYSERRESLVAWQHGKDPVRIEGKKSHHLWEEGDLRSLSLVA